MVSTSDKGLEDLKKQVLKDAEAKAPWWPVLLIAAILLVLWGINWWFASTFSSNRGEFGDMFGAANALFSGFALAGVVYSLWLQRTELAQQRRVTLLSVLELERSVSAQQGSEEALIKQNWLHVLSAAIEAKSALLASSTSLFNNGEMKEVENITRLKRELSSLSKTLEEM